MTQTFLVVDDSPVIRKRLGTMLEQLGTSVDGVLTAGTSEEALERFREEDPDVVFMDIRLPDVDGEQTARVILEEDPETRLVVVTGLMEGDERVRDLISLGAFEFLQKPIHSSDVENLLKLLEQEDTGAGRIR